MLMVNGEKLRTYRCAILGRRVESWRRHCCAIHLYMDWVLRWFATHTLSLVAFSGEKGIFQSRIVRKLYTIYRRYMFHAAMYLAYVCTMGICNDADAEVIYLCTNSANTTVHHYHCQPFGKSKREWERTREWEREREQEGKVLARRMALGVCVCMFSV